ncbi:MAG TPA: hypothetical protein VEB00_02075 [Clostridia bacterium]|nr:hypothetical protein [Clostridia bacterium]
MKRSRYALIVIAFLLLTLVGCQSKEQSDVQPQPEIKADTKLIEAVASDSINTEGMTKLGEFSNDIDMDNIEEKIELFTAAGRDEKGEMGWDDGQDWVLVVRDGDKSYPLLSQYVQLGVVYFTVSNSGEEPTQNITVIVAEGASFSMMGYAFDKEKNGFREEPLYKSEDDCWIYSSMPSY